MAITVEQNPPGMITNGQPIVYRVTSDNVSEDKFQFIFNIVAKKASADTSVEVLNETYKIVPDPDNNGIFNIRRIIEHLFSPQLLKYETDSPKFIEELGQYFNRNSNSAFEITVSFGESFVVGSNEFATDTSLSGALTTIVYSGSQTPKDGFHFKPQHGTMIDGDSQMLYYDAGEEKTGETPLAPITGTTKIREIFVSTNDRFTLSWIDQVTEGNVFDSNAGKQIATFVSKMVLNDGSTNEVSFANNSGNGGTTGANLGSTILSLKCGPLDIVGNTSFFSSSFRPTEANDWKYYLIYGADASNNLCTVQYKFIRRDRCPINEHIQLEWTNRYGQWNYQSFQLLNTKELVARSKTYQKVIGDIQSDGNFGFLATDSHERMYPKTGDVNWELVSDWITEAQHEQLEDLFLSKHCNAYISGSITPTPMILKSVKFKRKTRRKDRLIQFQVLLRESQKRNKW